MQKEDSEYPEVHRSHHNIFDWANYWENVEWRNEKAFKFMKAKANDVTF